MSTVAAAQPLAADLVVAEASVPPLVPAQMLNEYANCPALFSQERVDSLWASNTDRAEGQPTAPAGGCGRAASRSSTSAAPGTHPGSWQALRR
jgi:hypothetical protein